MELIIILRSHFSHNCKGYKRKVPHPHQNGANNTNCEYCDDVWNSKNCYLSRSMEFCEDLLYSYRNMKVKNSIDAVICFTSGKIIFVSQLYKFL
jgi:hypothetical protein